jgi:very-short-patch-repair endonuclease
MDSDQIELFVEHLSSFSLAAQQNAYPLIKRVNLNYERVLDTSQTAFKDLSVTLESNSDLFECVHWIVDELSPGQSLTLADREIKASREGLLALTEILVARFSLIVRSQGSDLVLARKEFTVEVLPANYWGGESRQPELLAAFVKPNGTYVESLVREATELLEKMGEGRKADGYQSNTREKPYLMASALWNVIFAQKISYVTPPASFASSGQRIRLPAEISTSKIAACMDTSILFASCLELMGLNTVIALTKGHAFVGVWLIDERFPVLTNDDPMDLRKRVDSRDIVLFESTLVTNSSPVTFEQAKQSARELIEEENEEDFVYLIDIAQARARKIRPLSTVETVQDEKAAENADVLPLPVVPPLPPVRADERVIDNTPETRIDTWQRKLLDLTKKNSLLSMQDRSIGVRLFCPDIGELEDRLADGNAFTFLSSEDSPLNDSERSNELFRLQNGNDLHRSYAADQLSQLILIANASNKRLEHCLISLLRKAKNDLEEGGSNTLFLALGVLRWKENPEDTTSYRAPLILLPVELIRKSAKAKIKIRQLQDESPIFNMTLIEFLATEYEIDLSEFRDVMPEDDSGIDVAYVWNRVRAAVAEQPGFEVVEELVLSSFSFSKYLMWKDLKDRLDDLRCNPFVNHLVESPEKTYQQKAEFIEHDTVDTHIDPDKIFTPLNCDSFQLVAVEASGKPQDFVLEGPPGTGKSETIANIICHNLALGRKVLFVAEKMAALNVVYRRMEKVGLDHLCLELHSNKSNKKAVLEQLRVAVERREEAEQNDWVSRAKELKEKRDKLNDYVQALHEKSQFGISTREAISRDVLYKDRHTFRLPWPEGLNTAPVKNRDELNAMLDAIKQAAIAFEDIADIEPMSFKMITSLYWSNAWQSQMLNTLEGVRQALDDLVPVATDLAEQFKMTLNPITIDRVTRISCLSTLINEAEARPIGYLFGNGVRETLDDLSTLQKDKQAFDETLGVIAHGVTAEKLAVTPVLEWVTKAESAKNWFKAFFARWKINRSAKKLGYDKFKDLTAVLSFKAALSLYDAITKVTSKFEPDGIWQGWQTTSKDLETASVRSKENYDALSKLMGMSDDPGALMASLKSQLVEGRDFLSQSKAMQCARRFDEKWRVFESYRDKAKELNLQFDKDKTLLTICEEISTLIQHAPKFKPWVEWQNAVKSLKEYELSPLAESFLSGHIVPEEAEDISYTAVCRWLAPQLIDQCDVLRLFKASSHEQLVKDFRALDQEVAETTSAYIGAITAEKMPDPLSENSAKEFGLLARELQKKSRHKPIRALISDMGANLLDLCPCMMMSPLSVAQFLPSHFNGFDLVVFDEASQITTWDSVGAIARGKNVIVVGDPKQMPPTNFFGSKSGVETDNPDEEDLESILDQALAARLPHLRLNGHYRSKHETLIAFSNNKYYDNKLVTYPSCDTKSSAVTFHRVDGVYAKGKSRTNAIEAAAVVEEIIRRLQSKSLQNQSIGVVTLNAEQQKLIEDLLDDARRRNPDIEPFFYTTEDYDGVFVKNLESVQGDERDVIIISLGYGPTVQGGNTMSMNFGPLNRPGGERRLNVAITRAKSEVLVFASFDPSMIDLSRTSAIAVEHLKHYLEFAQKGPIALSQQATAEYGVDQFDSDFEEAVSLALRNKGWKVQTQVGVSKFRIDLGIVHPDNPGTYLAGVECDGATYHGSPAARDRDRVRHIILENLGWRLIRLWSTDYFQDPESAIERIDKRLHELLALDKLREEQARAEEASVTQETNQLVNDQKIITHSDGEIEESRESSESRFSHVDYFEDSHVAALAQCAKEILDVKNGITLNELALDLANLHGLSRTSKKQLDHVMKVIGGWAGIQEIEGQKTVIWRSPDDVKAEISWRGLDAFGEERNWIDIPYPEVLGLAREAKEKQPNDPVNYICETLQIKRRHESTIKQFQEWVDAVAV